MKSFEDIKLNWKGEQLVIPSNKVMRAIALIENSVTMHELGAFHQRGTAPMARIAMAYADVINFAGGKATAEEVYAGMFSGGDTAGAAQAAIDGLLQLMLPPGDMSVEVSPKKLKAAAPSSRKRTKQRSEASGSPRLSSGN